MVLSPVKWHIPIQVLVDSINMRILFTCTFKQERQRVELGALGRGRVMIHSVVKSKFAVKLVGVRGTAYGEQS